MSDHNKRVMRELSRDLKRAAADLSARTPQEIRLTAEQILTDVKTSSQGRGVPVDEGTLRDTGRVRHLGGKRFAITFGGPAAPYALVQHERLDFRHEIGEARYLVRGLERWARGTVGDLMQRTQDMPTEVLRRRGFRG